MKKYFLLNALFLILLCSCQSEPIDNTNKSTLDSSENINNSMHAKNRNNKRRNSNRIRISKKLL